jgi:hypothetical protein
MNYFYYLAIVLFLYSCGGQGLSDEDKKWIENKIVEISDSIHKSSLTQDQTPEETPKELWNRVNLSLPNDYNVGSIKPFEYSGIPKFDANDMDTYGYQNYSASGFYPIGWSLNGLYFAYMYKGVGYGGEESIVILNVQKNEIESSLVLSEWSPDDYKTYYKPHDKVVEDFVRKYEICKHFDYQKGDSFKSSINGNMFNFEVKTDEEMFWDYDGSYHSGQVEVFANMISPESKRKKIISYEHPGFLLDLGIHGFIKSPVDNKVILLISYSERGYELEVDVFYRLITCDLSSDSF